MKIKKLIKNLQHLIDSQTLLNDILVHYDIYRKEFDNKAIIKEHELSDGNGRWNDTLNARIRDYLKFNDSE